MTYDYREKKIIAVISDSLSPGQALNALGHLAYSAGRYANQGMMGKEELIDADNAAHVGISKYPFIVLKAPPEEIKNIVRLARKNSIFVVDYPQEMFDTGPDDELVEAMAKAREPGLRYHACVLVGETEKLKTITGHLKLYR
jgi:hypothetical protein